MRFPCGCKCYFDQTLLRDVTAAIDEMISNLGGSYHRIKRVACPTQKSRKDSHEITSDALITYTPEKVK